MHESCDIYILSEINMKRKFYMKWEKEMNDLLTFGFHSVNEFGQANVGVYAQVHPFSALVIGLGIVFVIYLIYKMI